MNLKCRPRLLFPVAGAQPTKFFYPNTIRWEDFAGKIVECSWNFQKEAWQYMRVRTDKATPNFVTVYIKIVVRRTVLGKCVAQLTLHLLAPQRQLSAVLNKREGLTRVGKYTSYMYLTRVGKYTYASRRRVYHNSSPQHAFSAIVRFCRKIWICKCANAGKSCCNGKFME